ncbi:MAG TPA: calcium-binding protein [Rhizobiaceae bacterium]|nr:calcium-binding protein [Rhizobiaceae bacterium]
MVTKIVNAANPNAGNLNNPADFFGVQDDIVIVQATGNPIVTLGGADFVEASASTGFQYAYLGLGADEYRGGTTGTDHVHDGGGADIVNFSGGLDTIYVGAGNDIFRGGAGFDTVSFRYESNNSHEGTLVLSGGPGIVIDLAKTTPQAFGRFGRDTISGFEAVDGSGGSDKIYGTNAENSLYGWAGNDLLEGRGGRDTLAPGAGADIVIGGLGADTIFLDFADNARDIVRYSSIQESGLIFGEHDYIWTFVRSAGAAGDRIDLSRIDANPFVSGNQTFAWRAMLPFRENVVGEVRFIDVGTDLIVQVDTDRDNGAEMTIRMQGEQRMAAFDFIF